MYKQQHMETQTKLFLVTIKLHCVEEWNLEAEQLLNKDSLANMKMATIKIDN